MWVKVAGSSPVIPWALLLGVIVRKLLAGFRSFSDMDEYGEWYIM